MDAVHVHGAFRKDVLLYSWKETGLLLPWSTPELERWRDSTTVVSQELHDYGEVPDVFGWATPGVTEETLVQAAVDQWLVESSSYTSWDRAGVRGLLPAPESSRPWNVVDTWRAAQEGPLPADQGDAWEYRQERQGGDDPELPLGTTTETQQFALGYGDRTAIDLADEECWCAWLVDRLETAYALEILFAAIVGDVERRRELELYRSILTFLSVEPLARANSAVWRPICHAAGLALAARLPGLPDGLYSRCASTGTCPPGLYCGGSGFCLAPCESYGECPHPTHATKASANPWEESCPMVGSSDTQPSWTTPPRTRGSSSRSCTTAVGGPPSPLPPRAANALRTAGQKPA